MFGRKKGGFAREVLITEFENEVNEDILREEEKELEAERELEGQNKTLEETEEKIDLIDFLDDTDDEELRELEAQAEELVDERSESEILADFIRDRSRAALLTSKTFLYEEDANMEEVLASLKEDETCNDITTIDGEKDIYFYSAKEMSDNYAMIAMLVEEKDLSRIIAEMVRWNAKTYPCATPIYYFKNSPYHYNDEEIEAAINNIKEADKYKDIGELITNNNRRYLYSTLHMSEKYARALANRAEFGEGGYY